MSDVCEYCHEPMDQHRSCWLIDGIGICHLATGLTMRTQVSDRATGRTTRSATPDGRGATTRRDRAGTIPAAEILTRFDTAYPWWARYRDQLAALRDAQGKKPQPGRHATGTWRNDIFGVAFSEMQAAADGLMGLRVRHG